MAPRRTTVGIALVVFVALLSGCAAVDPPTATDDPDPADVFEGAFVHSDDLEDVRGERTTTVEHGDERRTETVIVSERPYLDYRSEVVDSPGGDRDGERYVSNATSSWQYDPETNVASVSEVDEPFDDDVVRTARADEADRQLELYDLEYRGTETIADRETHVLAVEAKNESVAEGISLLVGDKEYVYALETVDPADELEVTEQTVWIDAEYDYPLKEEVVVDDLDGGAYVLTERFETVAFNTELEDETFAFEPPANATVEELE